VLEQLRSLFVFLFLADTTAAKSTMAVAAAALSPVHNVAIGFLTGAITSAATEPVDVIRTRLMAQVSAQTSFLVCRRDVFFLNKFET